MTVLDSSSTTTDIILIDEETPLLAPLADDAPLKKPDESDLETQRQRRKLKPLPMLQISIILLLQLCEPLMSQSIYPYINQLVGELDITGGDERKIGYYAGLIESLFYATEAITVLQWSRLSDYIGRKPVLLTGIIGSSLSMLCFGMSRSFWTLVISRCLCGLLNGNIGVMKSVMGELTNSSNRAEGFAMMPVVWATGSTLGPLLGGSLSKPHENFPSVFKSQFWQDYPYFLPCLATTSVAFLVMIFVVVCFKETVPKRRRGASVSSEMTLTDEISDGPLPLRKILVYPVLISVANYVTIAFINIMLNALLPLFFAMPIEFDDEEVWGEEDIYGGMSVFGPCFMLMPVMSLCAKTWGVGIVVWSLLVVVFIMLVIMDMAYGSIFMYVTASAPNKRSLGATNGLSQMTVSISRAIGPALSTSLFSYSVQHNVLGGYAVYLPLTIVSLLGLVLGMQLPEHVWEEKDD